MTYETICRKLGPVCSMFTLSEYYCVLLVQRAKQRLEHISVPILCNRCLGAIVGSWPLAFQVWVLLQYIRAKVRHGPSHRLQARRNLVHCNQRCIHQPQSNHQSDLEPNIALLFFHSADDAFSHLTYIPTAVQ